MSTAETPPAAITPASNPPQPDHADGKPEYPALQIKAHAMATRAQKRSLLIGRLDIILIIVAAIVTAASVVAPAPFVSILATLAAVAVALTFVRQVVEPRLPYQQHWARARAVAEDAKTMAWRYMMGVKPFDDPDADARFIEELKNSAQAPAAAPLNLTLSDGREITPSMTDVRALPAAERKELYLRHRLGEQIDYYTAKSQSYSQSARKWESVSNLSRLGALAVALVHIWIAAAAAPLQLFVALSASAQAWTELVKFRDLSDLYARTAADLVNERRALSVATTDETVAACIADAETIMSREHGTWIAEKT